MERRLPPKAGSERQPEDRAAGEIGRAEERMAFCDQTAVGKAAVQQAEAVERGIAPALPVAHQLEHGAQRITRLAANPGAAVQVARIVRKERRSGIGTASMTEQGNDFFLLANRRCRTTGGNGDQGRAAKHSKRRHGVRSPEVHPQNFTSGPGSWQETRIALQQGRSYVRE